MRFRLFTILLITMSLCVNAQSQNEQFIKELIESIAEDLPEDFDFTELQDKLSYYQKHPINLNKTTTEELKGLFFLTPLQIGNLFQHIQKNGVLIDVYELQAIESFDELTLQRLLPFVTVNANVLLDKITLNNLKKYSDNDLVIRFGTGLETAKGYTNLPGSRYLGSKERLLMRYRYQFSNRISASLIFEKDAGEYIINGPKLRPFDYQSAHIGLYQIGVFKKIIVGDYNLQFGQGLTLWSGFAFGKAQDVASIAKRDVGLKPYTSANEYSFFRGIATTIQVLKNISLTPFYSNRNLDASIDSVNNIFSVSTINQTGLHRTSNEINNKNSLNQQVIGGALNFQHKQLSLGLIAYNTKFDKPFITGNQVYRQYYFTGNSLNNIGFNYNYVFKNSYVFGEFAKSLNGGSALLNGALFSLSSKVSATILYRNYQKNYHNFFNQALAEASEAINENGLYVGININPVKAWNISIYSDYFEFPWLKFRVDAPSKGYETLAQITYTPTKTFKAFFRYKIEEKQQNTDLNVPINYLDNVNRSSYRLDFSWKLGKSFGIQQRAELSQFKKGDAAKEYGYLIYQDISYKPLLAKLTGNIRLAYFNTASFNSRIYAYEDDVLYNFSFGMYNGKGFRTYINLKYKLAKKLDIWARYALFKYLKTTTIGTGLDEINGNHKTDIKLQLRYQF